MIKSMIIALDVMGGDQGPEMVISAAELAAIRHPNCHFLLYGDQIRIAPLLAKTDRLKGRADIRHCDVVVGAEDRPSQALRRGRNVSSMWRAIDAVGLGEADLAVSAGNTGALMAMARFVLKTMPGISRPAIAVIWPTLRGETIVLDMGATIGANQLQLVEFAFMGSAMARCLFGLQRPSVALLNVGVEEIKGLEEVKAAAGLLRKLDVALEYVGFAEGDDIAKGRADVIVTEGFTGNIALKTAEGTARQISTYMRQAIKRTWLSRLGAFLAQGAFAALKERMDPRKYNGGVFLGLNGIVVKSHGGSDAVGFATAVDLAINMKRNDLVAKIHADTHILERLRLSPENSRDI